MAMKRWLAQFSFPFQNNPFLKIEIFFGLYITTIHHNEALEGDNRGKPKTTTTTSRVWLMLFHFHFSLIMMKNMAYYSNNKVFFLFVMFFSSSLLHLGMCDSAASLDQLLPGLAQGDFLQDAKCMQRLLPCQEFLKSPNNPSPACCEPLKEMHENNTQCLCNFVNNTPLFQSLGASKDEILKLPQACGIDVELSKCNNTTAGGGSSQGN